MTEDQDWAARLAAARANRNALGQLLNGYSNFLYAQAEAELGRDLMARLSSGDLVQITFLEAYRALPAFVGTTRPEFESWLRSILHHNVLSEIRQNRDVEARAKSREEHLGTTQFENLADSPDTPSQHVRAKERHDRLHAAISRLDPKQQQVIRLRMLNRHYDEIAQIMETSADAARKLWARAVVRLRHHLPPELESSS